MQLNGAKFEFNGATGVLLKPWVMRRERAQGGVFNPFVQSKLEDIVPAKISIKVSKELNTSERCADSANLIVCSVYISILYPHKICQYTYSVYLYSSMDSQYTYIMSVYLLSIFHSHHVSKLAQYISVHSHHVSILAQYISVHL